MDYRECKNCKKSIQGDSAFCPYCGNAVRIKDAPIADKLLKRFGKPTRGTDAPVDIEVRKFKKRLLMIGIPAVVVLLAVAVWFILTSSNGDEVDPGDIPDHVFSDPLPDDYDIEPLVAWHPESGFDSLIWGDYIIKLPYDTPYIQTRDGASLMGIVDDDLVVADFTDFLAEMQYESMQTEYHINDTVSKLPLRIIAGPNSLSRDYEDLAAAFAGAGYGFLEYWVYSEAALNATRIGFPYKVEGNRIFVYTDWYDGEEVEVEPESAIEFVFFFDGFYLVLEREGLTVTMIPRQFVDDEPIINIQHRVLGDAKLAGITEIEHFTTRAGTNNASGVIFKENPAHSVPANIELYRCGRMRIHSDDTELWVRYIWSEKDGLILIDENGNIYLFQMLGGAETENIDPTPTPEPTPEPPTFLELLAKAFADAGSEVDIDDIRGTVTVNNRFLFERNSYEIAEENKENLNNLFNIIADVIQSDDYVGTVAKIIIEGHTCSHGSASMNLRLSENRAQAVKNFAIIAQPELAEIMETIGKGYSELIYNEDGNEDREASRRVVLLFDIRVAT